jgi:uncharacterized protein (TIGR03067 family)
MRRWTFAVLFLAAALVADAKPIRPEKDAPPESLDGVWVSTSFDSGGRGPNDVKLKMTFSADKFTLNVKNETMTAKIAFDFKKKPAEMDITPIDGPFQGQFVPAIFHRDGVTLKVCMGDLPGRKRPTEFKAGGGDAVIVLKLQK